MKTPPKYSSLAEFILDENEFSSLSKKSQLVRILSRSSTLPKVEDVFINVLEENPEDFVIVPGKSIGIGSQYLNYPVAALLCLRYGLEWQIWYRNQPEDEIDVRLCDIAACRVAAKFHELTPQEDKKFIEQIPPVLAENILKFKEEEEVCEVMEEVDFKALKRFHGQDISTSPLKKKHLNILQNLASPVEYLMMSDGDLRLKVDPDRLLNKYGCRPFPRPEAFSFASSTASSISNHAYNKAQFKRKRLIKRSFENGLIKSLIEFADYIKSDIKKYLQIPESDAVILAPSGTDISLKVAGTCQAVYRKEICHILVAADETGSGVPAALRGEHFSNTTARAMDVVKGERVPGFRDAELQEIVLRNADGQLKKSEEVDREVEESIQTALAEGKQPVLHVIDQSKLGYIAPSEACLQRIDEAYAERVLVCVDNSQLRMDPEDIRAYLERGYLMILTGSKFFTGPPFNGALLIPYSFKKRWEVENPELPVGLKAYFFKNEWPDWFFPEVLEKGGSPGVYTRWYAALKEIERYYQTPLSLRYFGVEMFCAHVKNTIDHSPFLEHLRGYNLPQSAPKDGLRMKEIQTIFPFFIKKGDRVLSKPELDTLYKLLNTDLSQEFPEAPDEVLMLVARACHIGQPVAAVYKDGTSSGVVRINLGARVISESWKDKDSSIYFKTIEEQMIQVSLIIRKIELILERPDLYIEE